MNELLKEKIDVGFDYSVRHETDRLEDQKAAGHDAEAAGLAERTAPGAARVEGQTQEASRAAARRHLGGREDQGQAGLDGQ